MATLDEIKEIIRKIVEGTATDKDIDVFHQVNESEEKISLTFGKQIINLGQGTDNHFGNRIYKNWDKEAMEAFVKAIQKTSGIHQNTQDGDVAARDIDKGITYENCTIIQLLSLASNLGNASPSLLNKLDFSGIPQESFQQAYQDALPPDASVWNLEGNDITQKLQVIEEFRKSFEFVKQLSKDENIPQKIRDKLSGLAEELAAKKHSGDKTKPPTDFSSNPKGQLESYLIATLERCDNDNEKFLMNAWLIIDDSLPVNDLFKFISLLDKDEQELEILCKFNEIPQQLNKFLKKSLRLLRGKQYQLIIEVLLPSDLIGTEVDRWKISDPILEEITLGVKYPIRLRSLERLKLDYLDSYLSDWYKSWDKVKAVLHNEAVQELFEHLKEMDNFNWKSLKNNLQNKIGLKVTCAPPKAKTEDLFKAILTSTTPIAIWTRCDIPNFDQVTAIDEILSFKQLCHLCESVRQTREQADAQTEEHLGFHLALLWEDPHRLTPDVMLQLTTPGQ